MHLYKFNATIGSPAEIDDVSISNQGNLTQTTLGPILPFSVPEVIHFRPSVSIEKTVHKGPLITCSNGLELYAGREREIITYCFQVTNTGNSYLDQVVVTDPGNNMTNITTIPMLAPGETTFVKFETQIPSLPIRTNATVIAEPRLVNKNIIPTYTGGPVTDSDDAGVNPIPYLPAITVKKYAGPQGSSCSIGNMKDDTYLAADTKFEYCYVVSSTGDECLLNVTLTDNSIGGIGIQSIPKLCSNDTAFTISGPGTISIVDVPSTDVSVKAIGENSGKEVTSADPAAVDIPDFAPMVSVKKYAGPPGSSCSISTMKDDVYLAQDTKFEYCYVVSNVGDECLINVTLTDAAIGGIGTQSIPKLCPFDTPISITGPTTTSLVDIAPTDASVKGKGEYSTKEVTAKDPAAIDIPAFAPRVSVKKYAGPPGSSCSIGNMQDDIFSALDTKFEYCYVISNTGNECVVDLTLSDAAVGGIGVHSITKLCPSDTAILVTGPTTTSLVDVPPTDAAVKGKGEYSGLETTAKDPAGIDIPNFAPTISIKKYAGPEGASCDVEKMKDDTYVTEDSKFEYCYVIINTGNECVLNLNIIDNAAGGIGSQGLGMVCPGDEPIEISGPPSTTIVTIPQTDAVVTGNGQYSGIAASAQDPASVEYVPLGIPSISIEKTVHLGELPTCFDGRELEYGFSGTVVTYCYEVTNTGDVLLNVVLTDVPVGTSESFPLAPGSSIFVKKVSSITSDLTSPGVVKGTPTDGRPPVEDSDPAGVKLVPDKVPCVPESDING